MKLTQVFNHRFSQAQTRFSKFSCPRVCSTSLNRLFHTSPSLNGQLLSRKVTQSPATRSRQHSFQAIHSHPPARQANSSADKREVEKFSKLSKEWWDSNGQMKTLHDINPLRIKYIRDHFTKLEVTRSQRAPLEQKNHSPLSSSPPTFSSLPSSSSVLSPSCTSRTIYPFQKKEILDVGCGAGLLTESFFRLGGNVVGLDAAEQNIHVAKAHFQQTMALEGACPGSLTYVHSTIETFMEKNPGKQFDLVSSLEVLEHVQHPEEFITNLVSCTKPGGYVVLSTLNKTWNSWLLGIVAAEQILELVPRGTHEWQKFQEPSKVTALLQKAGARVHNISGIWYNPLTREPKLQTDLSVNYILFAQKK